MFEKQPLRAPSDWLEWILLKGRKIAQFFTSPGPAGAAAPEKGKQESVGAPGVQMMGIDGVQPGAEGPEGRSLPGPLLPAPANPSLPQACSTREKCTGLQLYGYGISLHKSYTLHKHTESFVSVPY